MIQQVDVETLIELAKRYAGLFSEAERQWLYTFITRYSESKQQTETKKDDGAHRS